VKALPLAVHHLGSLLSPSTSACQEVSFWHIADIPPALTNVRYRG